MSYWESALSIVGALVTGAVGFVARMAFSHEVRITKLETEAGGAADDLREIKADIKALVRSMGELREQLAGMR